MTNQPAEVAEFVAAARAAEARLLETLAALRAAAKCINDLGALASALQREAQDIEYAAVTPELRAFLDGSYIQRTGYVNNASAKVAEQVRLLSRGVSDLMADGKRAVELAEGL